MSSSDSKEEKCESDTYKERAHIELTEIKNLILNNFDGGESAIAIARVIDSLKLKPTASLIKENHIPDTEFEKPFSRTPANAIRAALHLVDARKLYKKEKYFDCLLSASQARAYCGSMTTNILAMEDKSKAGKASGKSKHEKNTPVKNEVQRLLETAIKDGGLKPDDGWKSISSAARLIAPAISTFIKEYKPPEGKNGLDLVHTQTENLVKKWMSKDPVIRGIYEKNALPIGIKRLKG